MTTNSESVKMFWTEFCQENPNVPIDTPYQVWFFHHNRDSSKKLVELVLRGTKKGTASLMEDESDFGEGGIVGGYSLVTDFDGTPQCVIQTTEVRQLPFIEVDAQFAFDEGEGDKTLEYWRNAHRRFFTECCRELDIEFNEKLPVCCKRFKLLFPKFW